MTTTISGTTVTFTDGSTWGGANGTITPETLASSRQATSFNTGHIILANCIFSANNIGYESGGFSFWALNNTNFYHIYSGYINANPGVNTAYADNDSRLGSQSYYERGGTTALAGTWKNRGQACGAGINQTFGYFVLMERVA